MKKSFEENKLIISKCKSMKVEPIKQIISKS